MSTRLPTVLAEAAALLVEAAMVEAAVVDIVEAAVAMAVDKEVRIKHYRS